MHLREDEQEWAVKDVGVFHSGSGNLQSEKCTEAEI